MFFLLWRVSQFGNSKLLCKCCLNKASLYKKTPPAKVKAEQRAAQIQQKKPTPLANMLLAVQSPLAVVPFYFCPFPQTCIRNYCQK